jgi:hypothetical protein
MFNRWWKSQCARHLRSIIGKSCHTIIRRRLKIAGAIGGNTSAVLRLLADMPVFGTVGRSIRNSITVKHHCTPPNRLCRAML